MSWKLTIPSTPGRARCFLAAILSCLALQSPLPGATGPDPQRLASKNAELRQRLEALQARGEMFRWSAFEQGPLLRTGSVLKSVACPDGHLAFATDNSGLVLYDGVSLQVLDHRVGLPDDFVTAFVPLDSQAAWIGTAGGLVRAGGGRVLPPDNLPVSLRGALVSCLLSDPAGGLWVGTQSVGLWRLDGGGWTCVYGAPDSLSGPSQGINDLALDPAGRAIWAATVGAGLLRVDSHGVQRFPAPLGPGSEEIYCLLAGRDGLLWLGSAGAGAGFLAGSQWRRLDIPEAGNAGVTCLCELSDGSLLFGTTAGAWLYEAGAAEFSRLPLPEELSPYPVISAIESHGSLWLGISGQGLHVFDLELVRRYGPEQGLPAPQAFSLGQSGDGAMWCATREGVVRLENGRWSQPREAEFLPDRLVTCLSFGPLDRKCFGTYAGVLLLEQDGSRTVLDRDNGLASNMINHLQTDPTGGLWISTEGGGLVEYHAGGINQYSEAEGLPSAQVQASLSTADGSVWVATRKGLALIREGMVLSRTAKGGPVSPGAFHFTSLCLGTDSSLWAATDGMGLWQLPPGGDWVRHGTESGLASEEVYSVARASSGRIAAGTALGLGLYDGTLWRNYGPQQGVGPGAVRSVFCAADSALWLCVEGQGVVRFNPDRFDPPETWVLSPGGGAFTAGPDTRARSFRLSTDSLRGQFYLPGGWSEPLEANPTDSLQVDSLTVELAALTPWWPGAEGAFRYSWRLDNGRWSAFSPRSDLDLKGLSPGAHVLSVRARGPHLRTDPTPSRYRFYVDLPGPWRDWRVYAGVAVLALIISGLLGRRRIVWWLVRARRRNFRPIQPNPFHPHRPQAADEPLPGREAELAALLREDGNQSLVLHAQPRSGLSSLLRHAAARMQADGAGAVLIDLSAPGLGDLPRLLRRLLESLGGQAPAAGEAVRPESLIPLVREYGRPVRLLFDGAEALGRMAARDSTLAARFNDSLRELLQAGDRVSLVFGVHSLEQFRAGLPQLYSMSRSLSLGPLSETAAAQALLRTLSGSATLHREALVGLARLSGGQPCLLQHLGFTVVELLNAEGVNYLEPEQADRAVGSLVESPPGLLLDRWDELSRTEKLLLSAAVALRSRSGRDGRTGLADIAGLLRSHGLPLLDEELGKAAALLAGRGLIAYDPASGRLDPGDTLLARWVRANCPPERVLAAEDYEPSELLHRAAGAMSQSFRAGELLERLFEVLRPALRFGWAAWLPHGPGRGAATGTGLPVEGLPETLPPEASECMGHRAGAFLADESAMQDWTVQVPAGTLLVPEFLHGELDGVFAFGPREGGQRYSSRDRGLLESMADQAAVALENVRLYEQETERERMRQELETARRMQLAILPERSFRAPGVEICAYLNPASEVGGDYFDYRRLDEDRLAFVIGDVSGHGLSAGTLVSMTKSCLFNQFRVDHSACAVLTAMNDMLRGALSERLLMTFCYTVFDTAARQCIYSIAGHPFPYHLSAAGELSELELPAYPLGARARNDFKQRSLSYSPGDLFVFYSDGIVEGLNPEGEQYGFERFEESIRRQAGRASVEAVSAALLLDFQGFARGAAQADDLTLVVIRTG
ncbi:SpoIIE family protein phosphatase [bacterium]|nr:SpoIIE family protein phosphatase [bacterium]